MDPKGPRALNPVVPGGPVALPESVRAGVVEGPADPPPGLRIRMGRETIQAPGLTNLDPGTAVLVRTTATGIEVVPIPRTGLPLPASWLAVLRIIEGLSGLQASPANHPAHTDDGARARSWALASGLALLERGRGDLAPLWTPGLAPLPGASLTSPELSLPPARAARISHGSQPGHYQLESAGTTLHALAAPGLVEGPRGPLMPLSFGGSDSGRLWIDARTTGAATSPAITQTEFNRPSPESDLPLPWKTLLGLIRDARADASLDGPAAETIRIDVLRRILGEVASLWLPSAPAQPPGSGLPASSGISAFADPQVTDVRSTTTPSLPPSSQISGDTHRSLGALLPVVTGLAPSLEAALVNLLAAAAEFPDRLPAVTAWTNLMAQAKSSESTPLSDFYGRFDSDPENFDAAERSLDDNSFRTLARAVAADLSLTPTPSTMVLREAAQALLLDVVQALSGDTFAAHSLQGRGDRPEARLRILDRRSRDKGTDEGRGWQVRVETDPPGGGPVRADLSLRENRMQIRLVADQARTAQALRDDVQSLRDRIFAVTGLEPAVVVVMPPRAPESPAPSRPGGIDIEA